MRSKRTSGHEPRPEPREPRPETRHEFSLLLARAEFSLLLAGARRREPRAECSEGARGRGPPLAELISLTSTMSSWMCTRCAWEAPRWNLLLAPLLRSPLVLRPLVALLLRPASAAGGLLLLPWPALSLSFLGGRPGLFLCPLMYTKPGAPDNNFAYV